MRPHGGPAVCPTPRCQMVSLLSKKGEAIRRSRPAGSDGSEALQSRGLSAPPAGTNRPGGCQDSAPSGPVPRTAASPSHVPPALSWAGLLLVPPSHDRGASPGACSGLGLGPRSLPRHPLLLRPPAAGSGTVGRPEALVLPGHGRPQLFPPVPKTRVFHFALVQSSSQKPGTFLWLGCLVA